MGCLSTNGCIHLPTYGPPVVWQGGEEVCCKAPVLE